LISSLLSTILFFAYVLLFGYAQLGITIICQIPYLLAAIFEVSWFFSGTEQFRIMVIKNSIIKISTAAAVFLFVKTEEDVWIYILINTLSLFAGQIVLWPFMLKQVRFCKPEWHEIRKQLRPNLILMVSLVAVSVYVLMDRIMIEWLSTREQVGFYENTSKIFNMCAGIIGAVGTVMLPRMTYLLSNSEKGYAMTVLSKSIRYIMTVAIAIAFGMAGIAREFSVIYFGDEFAACGIMIAIVSAALLFYSWENILKTQFLLPNSKDKIYVQGTIVAVICNLILNYLFIPRLGAVGAVIGTVGAQASAAVYESLRVRKELPFKQYLRDLLPLVLFGTAMFALCRFVGGGLGFNWYTLVAQIVSGALLFIILATVYYYRLGDELILKILKKVGIKFKR
jgi:O-antigen/teichoic acid export membrane protein